MDSKIMELIDREVALLPKTGSRERIHRERLYVRGKTNLCARFPGYEEAQYIARAVARKYRL